MEVPHQYKQTTQQWAFEYYLIILYESVRMLLLTAEHLWHPWSERRRKELYFQAQQISGRAAALRKRFIPSAMGKIERYFSDAFGLSITSSKDEVAVTKKLVAAAVALMLKGLGELQSLKRSFPSMYNEHRAIIHSTIEALMEAPYCGDPDSVPGESLRLLLSISCLRECEMLSFQKAYVQTEFKKRSRSGEGYGASEVKPEELKELADTFSVSLADAANALGKSYPPWREIGSHFRNQAESCRRKFLSVENIHLVTDAILHIGCLTVALEPQSTTLTADEVRKFEQQTLFIVAHLMSQVESELLGPHLAPLRLT